MFSHHFGTLHLRLRGLDQIFRVKNQGVGASATASAAWGTASPWGAKPSGARVCRWMMALEFVGGLRWLGLALDLVED